MVCHFHFLCNPFSLLDLYDPSQILVGLIIDLGGGPNHQRLGFQYWRNPGALNARSDLVSNVGLGRFLAIISVLVQAAFSFQGMELVAVCVSVSVGKMTFDRCFL